MNPVGPQSAGKGHAGAAKTCYLIDGIPGKNRSQQGALALGFNMLHEHCAKWPDAMAASSNSTLSGGMSVSHSMSVSTAPKRCKACW